MQSYHLYLPRELFWNITYRFVHFCMDIMLTPARRFHGAPAVRLTKRPFHRPTFRKLHNMQVTPSSIFLHGNTCITHKEHNMILYTCNTGPAERKISGKCILFAETLTSNAYCRAHTSPLARTAVYSSENVYTVTWESSFHSKESSCFFHKRALRHRLNGSCRCLFFSRRITCLFRFPNDSVGFSALFSENETDVYSRENCHSRRLSQVRLVPYIRA